MDDLQFSSKTDASEYSSSQSASSSILTRVYRRGRSAFGRGKKDQIREPLMGHKEHEIKSTAASDYSGGCYGL